MPPATAAPSTARIAAARVRRPVAALATARAAAPPAQAKGRQTRAAIVDAALALASRSGLESVSIGALATALDMSKSGVFAHFGAREDLLIAVIDAYHARFEREVFTPALHAARGLPRLRALFAHWVARMAREADQGCLFIGGAIEFDDRRDESAGPVRAALLASVQTWLDAVQRAVRMAQDAGHLRADADSAQIAFEIHALVLAMHHAARFLRQRDAAGRAHAGFERLLQSYASTAPPP